MEIFYWMVFGGIRMVRKKVALTPIDDEDDTRSESSVKLRVGDLSSGSGSTNHYSAHKVSKDDSGRFSGLLSSSGSPSRVGFSRCSSRLSLQDELDDIDFSCPFIVDDVDTCDSPLSLSVDGKQGRELSSHAKKSQDAAVGALLRMLRTAPPLRQDSSCYSSHSLSDGLEAEFNTASASASSLFMSRKTSDALEELKAYRELLKAKHRYKIRPSSSCLGPKRSPSPLPLEVKQRCFQMERPVLSRFLQKQKTMESWRRCGAWHLSKLLPSL